MKNFLFATLLIAVPATSTWATGLDSLEKFIKSVKTGRAEFVQIVTAPAKEGQVARTKKSSGTVEFFRPGRFKFAYKKPFEIKDHLRLRDTLKHTPFKFCLSYDDCKEVRELYSWANIYEKSWLYNTANISGSERSMGNELIITNYEVII